MLMILIISKLMVSSYSINDTESSDIVWISSTISNPYNQSDNISILQNIVTFEIAGWNIVFITVCIATLCCTFCSVFTHVNRRRNKKLIRKLKQTKIQQQQLNMRPNKLRHYTERDVIKYVNEENINITIGNINDYQMNIIKEDEDMEDIECCNDDENERTSLSPKGMNKNNNNNNNSNNKLHFICYLLICIYWGNISSLSGSLFSEIKKQLQLTTDLETSYIFIFQQISFCISSIITAIIIDKFINTHRWIGLLIFNGLICMLFIPFIDTVYHMYLLWIVQGFAHGSIEVGIPVFIFRKFSNNDIWMLLLSIQCLSKTISPLIIQFMINIFGNYSYSLLLFGFIGLISCIFLIFLSTPKHDKYRTIKLELEKSGSLKTAEQVMQEMNNSNNGKMSKYGLIGLFCLFFIFYSMIPCSMITYVSVYCQQYLNINHVFGRYLISTFFGGQLLYYFVTLIVCKTCKKSKEKQTFLLLLGGQIICVLLGIIWIFIIPFDLILLGLFIIFGSIGYILSFTYPTIYSLCESIYPINGIVSCIFTLSQGIGASIILLLMGELIKYNGMHILPYPITISSVLLIILTLFILYIHNKYKNHYKSLLFEVNRIRRFSSAVF